MLTTIHIQAFKGFKDTQITPLRKVNLVLGGQNVGKTSLLEAVYLGAGIVNNYQLLASLFRVAEGGDSKRYVHSVLGKASRNIDLMDELGTTLRTALNAKSHLTPNSTPNSSGFYGVGGIDQDTVLIERQIAGSFVNALDASKHLSFVEPLTVSVHLPNQLGLVQLFDQTVMSRKKRVLLEMLRGIEPRLEDMHSLSPDGEQRIYVELKGDGDALPLPQLGHGFSRLVHLYCSLLVTNAKLALIDEVENGIHYSSLPTLFLGIQDIAVRHDVQTMMTTHSWDCIRAAYNAFAETDSLKDFQLIRLEREGDNVRAVLINDEALDTVIEAGYEVR